MYVRYISHELRTPLNAAFLGLKLISDDLSTSVDDSDSDYRDTLLCIKSACRTAVEILNDLLCFDKLESGMLVVHKHDVSVIPFIADCVNMFASQAREAGVTIKNITNLVELLPVMEVNIIDSSSMLSPPSSTIETDLLNEDIVFMDKFKMDQVLRQCCQVHSEGGICDCVCLLYSESEER
jgi:signal transduction histidine kinase